MTTISSVRSPHRQQAVAGLGSVALALCLAAAGPTSALADPAAPSDAEPYDLVELQARSNLLVNDEGYNLPPGSSFNSITTALADDGTIAFPVQVATLPGQPTVSTGAIWLGAGGEGEIVHRLPENAPVSASVHINEAHEVAFTQAGGGVDNTLWLYQDSTGTAVQVETDPIYPTSFSVGGLDDAGNVGFQANFSGGRAHGAAIDGTGIFYVRDAGLQSDSPYSYLYSSSFNAQHQIASKVSLLESFNHQEIRRFEADGSSVRLAATANVDPDSPYRSFDNSVGLSDTGAVAAFATRADTNQKVLLRLDDDSVEEIATLGEDSPLASFDYFPPDINSSGQVVFRAEEKDGDVSGIWVADGTTLTRVLAQGDVVETDQGTAQLGQHDSSPVFGGSPQINERGDVSTTAGVHPEGDNTVEWGTGVFVAYASGEEEPPPPAHPESVERVAGDNRYETAATLAQANFTPGVGTVYIASGEAYPDALAGAALAGSEGGPVLLAKQTSIPSQTLAALTELEPGNIVVLGGEGAVDQTRLEQLQAYTSGTVTRVGGANRYETAALVAGELADPGTVYVASGQDYPDALAAAARAGAGDHPVLLVKKDSVPSAVQTALTELAPESIVLLGGTGSVDDTVRTLLEGYAPVERVAGDDRYDTAALLSSSLEAAELGFVASGQNWPDALAGAAVAGHLEVPVLLAKSDSVPATTVTELERLEPPHLQVLGGPGAIVDEVLERLRALDYTD